MTSRVQASGRFSGLAPFRTSDENELILHLLCLFEKEKCFFPFLRKQKQEYPISVLALLDSLPLLPVQPQIN